MTDPDIELSNVNGNILEFYISLLHSHNNKFVVGPMLQIDDIPDFYSKKKAVLRRHTFQFWKKKPITVIWQNKPYNIQYSGIDTTFQMIHRDHHYHFPRAGIRCYSPYSARHLDWYINPQDMTEDQKYYSLHASRIAHWSKNITILNTDIEI